MKKSSLLVVLLASTASTAFTASTAAAEDTQPAPPENPAATRSIVVHVAPLVVDPRQPIELVAQIDQPFAEVLGVRWRAMGDTEWQDALFQRSSASGWFAELPGSGPPGIEYYIRGTDAAGVEVAHFASEQAPHKVRVVPSLHDRLEVLDRERLRDRKNEIAIDVIGHNFGNRYGLADRYVRGELAYTRRLWRQLHSVTFGFGSISGSTPVWSAPPEMLGGGDTGHSLHYGFGGVRLRAHESVFFDARAQLGGSHDGFDGGIAGAITFGKPWRSCVSVGGEYLGDLGPSAWVRLQWDTAPPLLMGASIVRTDLPGAIIDSAGLYIAYDVAYRVVDRFTMRAQLSYGARDGEANFGGGLGSSIDF